MLRLGFGGSINTQDLHSQSKPQHSDKVKGKDYVLHPETVKTKPPEPETL